MVLYIDITEFVDSRYTTGIQRVITEFLLRAMLDSYVLKVICFDKLSNNYILINNKELKNFLADIKNYTIVKKEYINIYKKSKKEKIFFDLDSVWNTGQKRKELYSKLKKYNFKIFNFLYDLTPVLLPDMAKQDTKSNFPSFLQAVCEFSDFVFFDSKSSQEDFLKYQTNNINATRKLDTKVVHLGSDFTYKKSKYKSKNLDILDKKYILFVGTLEPRKKHKLVLDSFEELHKKYKDLHLVFIGRVGWKTQKLVSYMEEHPLKGKYFHHLRNIDDSLLERFYKNAFIVTYISEYEGYGLPVAESLQYSNITITSKNSSLSEVGENFADYIMHNDKKKLVDLISLYLENEDTYKSKKSFIKQSYIPQNWDMFYTSVINKIKHKMI